MATRHACTACNKYAQVVSLEKMLVPPRPLVTLILKWEQSCDRPIVFAAIFMVFSVVFWRRTFVFCKKEYLLKRLERANLCQSVANYLDNRWWSIKSFLVLPNEELPKSCFTWTKRLDDVAAGERNHLCAGRSMFTLSAAECQCWVVAVLLWGNPSLLSERRHISFWGLGWGHEALDFSNDWCNVSVREGVKKIYPRY